MTLETKNATSGVRVNVAIPEYKENTAPSDRMFEITLAGEYVSVGGLRFKRSDFDEALRVLGYKPGPTYRNIGDSRDLPTTMHGGRTNY